MSAQEFALLPNAAENLVTLEKFAEIAQLVEHNLAKVGVASSSLVFRSCKDSLWLSFFYVCSCSRLIQCAVGGNNILQSGLI